MGLADAVSASLINLFLSYLSASVKNDSASIDRQAQKLRWITRTQIYNCDLPRYALEQLEWLYPRIEFEQRSEGDRITPDWYIAELIRRAAVENSKVSLLAIVNSARTLFEQRICTARDRDLPWVRSILLTREAEYWQKVTHSFFKLKNRWRDLNSKKMIEGLPWADVDFNKLDEAIEIRKKQIVIEMAEIGEILSGSDRLDAYPDFAGQFLHAVGEELLSAMVRNDIDTVNTIFPAAFSGALRQYDRLAKNIDLSDFRGEIATKVAVAPILDVLQLSGYCILFSELNGAPKLAESVVRIWSGYLDERMQNSIPILSFLAAAISITETPFELAHRSLIRTAWKQTVADELRKLERRNVRLGPRARSARSDAVHDSPLVRVFARDAMGSFYDGIDVFIERLIRNRPNASEFKVSPRRRDLREAIVREERRGKESRNQIDQPSGGGGDG